MNYGKNSGERIIGIQYRIEKTPPENKFDSLKKMSITYGKQCL